MARRQISRHGSAAVMASRALMALAFAATDPTSAQAQTHWTLQAVTGPLVGLSGFSNLGMAYDSARGVTVLVTSNGETWEWNGSAWTQRGTLSSLSGSNCGMAYDAARGVIVYFVDYDYQGHFSGMFEWDGSVWTQRAVPGGQRPGTAIAYDSARRVTVLFLGDRNGYQSETWEWDGNAWTLRAITGPPPSLNLHAMAYDAARGVTVFFGGYDLTGFNLAFLNTCGFSNETWEWDGTYWTQLVTAGPTPSPRTLHAMAYDAARGRVVLFGGNVRPVGGCANVANGETWEWTGTHWTQGVACGPSPRWGHAMAYDSARGVTVLFGGVLWPGTSDETWELTSTPCYANCDGSACPPILNVNDFDCFLGRFAAGDPYANCDGSTAPPILNVNDFACFLGKFAAGCS